MRDDGKKRKKKSAGRQFRKRTKKTKYGYYTFIASPKEKNNKKTAKGNRSDENEKESSANHIM